MTVPVAGKTDPRFAAVRAAFDKNLTDGEDLGAACAVVLDGEVVVDLYGGWQDRKRETAWTPETIVGLYSTGKAVVALLVARAVDAGLLDYEAPVATWWPEFAAAGKDRITLAQIMSHQAGLPGIADEMDPALWVDWDAICARLAAMAPMWPPGTANGYQPQTFGFLAGEVLRRVTGKSVGELLRDEIAGPNGLDIYCGLTEPELARASHMVKPGQAPDLGELNAYTRAAFLQRWSAPAGISHEAWAAAEMPASNMHADARSLARLMAVFALDGQFEGEQMLSADVLGELSAERCRGDDLVLPYNLSWACGLMRNTNKIYGPRETTLGHSGFGGSCVFADPDAGLSFAYVMNRMSHHLIGDPRSLRLIDAVYEAL